MGRGGIRYGAGRPGWKARTEHCRAIDVRRFAGENMLAQGARAWLWRDPDSGEVRAGIDVLGRADGVTLVYAVDGSQVRSEVRISRTGCNFGGSRPWFHCPACERRVARLFYRHRRFACRHCQQVSYASQSEDAIGRAWRAQAKLEAKLGPYWVRPKHMHHHTREKLVGRIMELEQRREEALAAFVLRWLPDGS